MAQNQELAGFCPAPTRRLNFGHMLGPGSTRFLQEKLETFEYLHHRLRIDFGKPLVPQVSGALDYVERELARRGLPCLEQSEIYAFMPPLDDPAVLLCVSLYGRTGEFPKLLMLRREQGIHVIYEIVDCERVRLSARSRRKTQTSLEVPAPCETPPI